LYSRVNFSIIGIITAVALLFSGTLTTPLNIALAAAQVKSDSQDNCKEVSNGTQVDIKYS